MKKEKLINRSYVVSILLFIILFPGCNKGSTPPPPAPSSYTVKFALEGLEYVKQTEGKYLIYKDSASGALDSVVITKSLLEGKYTPALNGTILGLPYRVPEIYGQKFSLALTKVDGTSSIAWFTGNAETGGASSNSTDADLILNETYASGTGADNNNPSAFYYSKEYPVQSIPSITIEGKNYTNVIVGEYESFPDVNDPGYFKRTFYWSKGIGIVKRRIVTAGGTIKTHNLVRNN